MISQIQQAPYYDEDQYSFSDDEEEVIDSPNPTRKGQQQLEIDNASAQVGQRIFQQPVDSEKQHSFLKSRISLPHLRVNLGSDDDDAEDVLKLVTKLDARYHDWKENFQNQATLQGILLSIIEYFSINKENILKGTEYISSVRHTEKIKSWLNTGDECYKWTDDILHLIAYIRKYYMLHDIQQELEEYHQRLQELKADMSSSRSNSGQLVIAQKHIDSLSQELKNEKKETGNKGILKGVRFIVTKLSTSPLEHVGWSSKIVIKVSKVTFYIFKYVWELWNINNTKAKQDQWLNYLQRITVNIYSDDPDQQTLQEELQKKNNTAQDKLCNDLANFFKSVENCKTTEEVGRRFKEVGISFEVPSTIEEFQEQLSNKRFQRNLIQEYYHCVARVVFMNPDHITKLVRRKEQAKEIRINTCLPFIGDQIIACQNEEWPEIQKHFENLKIHLDSIQISEEERLPNPPTTKLEWKQCLQNEAFLKALARQWVDYQEAKAQLFAQAMKQCLLSKHNVERKFLDFRKNQYIIGLLSSVVQLAICLPQAKLYAITFALELFSKDLAKAGLPGAGAFYLFIPLYPNLHFKLEDIVFSLYAHLFGMQYKPNEYSLKSYKLTTQIHMFGLMMTSHTLLLLLKQALLWLNMRLIENCIMSLETKPMSQDARFIDMDKQYEERRITYKQRVEELEAELDKLREEDAKLIISPCYAQLKECSQTKEPSPPIEAEESDEFDLEKAEEEINQPETQKFDKETLNPFFIIAQSLEDADFNCFPPNVLEEFEDTLGFPLTDKSKENLQKHLESFFSESETKFMGSFSSNRFNYLRA